MGGGVETGDPVQSLRVRILGAWSPQRRRRDLFVAPRTQEKIPKLRQERHLSVAVTFSSNRLADQRGDAVNAEIRRKDSSLLWFLPALGSRPWRPATSTSDDLKDGMTK